MKNDKDKLNDNTIETFFRNYCPDKFKVAHVKTRNADFT